MSSYLTPDSIRVRDLPEQVPAREKCADVCRYYIIEITPFRLRWRCERCLNYTEQDRSPTVSDNGQGLLF